ncbi:MAG: sugar ABC transporter permease [Oligoflexales bacterium]|nr:sugar ABC transporter permease [Oligoflexales bacterium]
MSQFTSRRNIFGFLAPSITVLLFLLFIPCLYTLYLCFFEELDAIGGKKAFIGLKNFRMLLLDQEFLSSFFLLCAYILISTGLELAMGLGVALYLDRFLPKAKKIQALLLLPMFVIPVVSGLGFRYIFDPENGVLGSLFYRFNLEAPDILGGPLGAFVLVIAQDVWRMWPFMFIIIFAGLQMVSKEQVEAIKLDGANFIAQCRYVVLPALKPTLIVAILLKVIESFKAFTEIFVMTGGGPGNATTILPLFIVKQITDFREFSYGSAASFVLLSLSLIFIIIFSRLQSKFNGAKDPV